MVRMVRPFHFVSTTVSLTSIPSHDLLSQEVSEAADHLWIFVLTFKDTSQQESPQKVKRGGEHNGMETSLWSRGVSQSWLWGHIIKINGWCLVICIMGCGRLECFIPFQTGRKYSNGALPLWKWISKSKATTDVQRMVPEAIKVMTLWQHLFVVIVVITMCCTSGGNTKHCIHIKLSSETDKLLCGQKQIIQTNRIYSTVVLSVRSHWLRWGGWF